MPDPVKGKKVDSNGVPEPGPGTGLSGLLGVGGGDRGRFRKMGGVALQIDLPGVLDESDVLGGPNSWIDNFIRGFTSELGVQHWDVLPSSWPNIRDLGRVDIVPPTIDNWRIDQAEVNVDTASRWMATPGKSVINAGLDVAAYLHGPQLEVWPLPVIEQPDFWFTDPWSTTDFSTGPSPHQSANERAGQAIDSALFLGSPGIGKGISKVGPVATRKARPLLKSQVELLQTPGTFQHAAGATVKNITTGTVIGGLVLKYGIPNAMKALTAAVKRSGLLDDESPVPSPSPWIPGANFSDEGTYVGGASLGVAPNPVPRMPTWEEILLDPFYDESEVVMPERAGSSSPESAETRASEWLSQYSAGNISWEDEAVPEITVVSVSGPTVPSYDYSDPTTTAWEFYPDDEESESGVEQKVTPPLVSTPIEGTSTNSTPFDSDEGRARRRQWRIDRDAKREKREAHVDDQRSRGNPKFGMSDNERRAWNIANIGVQGARLLTGLIPDIKLAVSPNVSPNVSVSPQVVVGGESKTGGDSGGGGSTRVLDCKSFIDEYRERFGMTPTLDDLPPMCVPPSTRQANKETNPSGKRTRKEAIEHEERSRSGRSK